MCYHSHYSHHLTYVTIHTIYTFSHADHTRAFWVDLTPQMQELLHGSICICCIPGSPAFGSSQIHFFAAALCCIVLSVITKSCITHESRQVQPTANEESERGLLGRWVCGYPIASGSLVRACSSCSATLVQSDVMAAHSRQSTLFWGVHHLVIMSLCLECCVVVIASPKHLLVSHSVSSDSDTDLL